MNQPVSSRRSFLAVAAASTGLSATGRADTESVVTGLAGSPATSTVATTEAAESPISIPRVRFFGTEITRLVIGSNPLYGYSHFNSILNRTMTEWMTPDRRVETLHRAEAAGINTWQVHYNDVTIQDLKRYRDEGGNMNWILLADFAMMQDWRLIREVAKLGPLGIAHHGNRTDDRFREGSMDVVHDFVKAVQDAGLPGGVSTHNPAVIEFIERRGWRVDYYMACLYHVTRSKEELRREFGEAPLSEPFMERDPERMTAMIRQTRRPCFAFKLLGAGRLINNAGVLDAAFGYALQNIKPGDAVIVGMFPKYGNEMRENAERVARLCGKVPSE